MSGQPGIYSDREAIVTTEDTCSQCGAKLTNNDACVRQFKAANYRLAKKLEAAKQTIASLRRDLRVIKRARHLRPPTP